MNWRRIPHRIVIAVAFGAIAAGVAAAIVTFSASAVRESDSVIRYAAVERQGITAVSLTDGALRRLLRYRAAIAQAQVNAGHAVYAVPAGAGSSNPDPAIETAIEAIRTASGSPALDAAAADAFATLQQRWLLTSSQSHVSAADVSSVIRAIQPIIVSFSGASGLSNDPSIDGQNFADALLRFPVALTLGSEAGTAAMVADRDGELHARFEAARLLAQAQTAVDVGVQDGEDEMSVDPVAAAPLQRAAARTMRDFEALRYLVTDTYVESRSRQITRSDRIRSGDLVAAFTGSSLSMIDALRANLSRVTAARIAQARDTRWRVIAGGAAAVALDIALMVTLAWFSIVSDRNARRRVAADKRVLESQRTSLEVQLTRAKAEQALLMAKAQFRAVFDRAPTGLIIVDRRGVVLDENEAAQTILSEDGERIALSTILEGAPPIEQMLAGDYELYEREHRLAGQAGAARWFHVSISPVTDDSGAALFAIVMLREITEGKRMEAQLVFEAGHDALTGLPNRKQFLTLLQQALDERSGLPYGDVFSVVFIDFNDFKTINDSFGHQAGDLFLIEGAARLRDSVRSTDIVARIGGDEFALLLHGSDRMDIEKNVARLQTVLSAPVDIESQLVASSASFGIAQADRGYAIAAEIIRDADTAMYQAKANGGRNYVVFDKTMRDQVVRRMQLSIDIIHALDHGELELLYQPIVDLRTGRIAGCEALIRWRRADGTLILPSEFMPLAEENGSIIEIGHWVTNTACRQMQSWNEWSRSAERGLPDDFVIHVNLAVPEVHHVDLLANLRQALANANVNRRQIILEITEGIILKNTPNVRSTLDALTREGFRLCIDDFGTGYSSLRYLNELPLDCFKIDRSFVSNGGDGLANASIVEMLMVLSRSLELAVVAEGIETAAQWRSLHDLGCRFGQGYLFARPLHGAAFTELLVRDAPLAAIPPALAAASY